MLKYKINVYERLYNAGFTTYTAKKTGKLSQETMIRLKKGDTNISAKTLDTICGLLDLQPGDILRYENEDV